MSDAIDTSNVPDGFVLIPEDLLRRALNDWRYAADCLSDDATIPGEAWWNEEDRDTYDHLRYALDRGKSQP